jgi:cysteine synthase A
LPAPVVDNVLSLIGSTPLIRLRRIATGDCAAVWAKAEHLEPGGSVKDRIALAMIEDAEREGRLRPGQTVVEATSGNTGISLALVCAVKGYPLVLTMPASMSLERRQLLAAYGARIELSDPERVMQGAIEAAERIEREEGAFMPRQFENPSNPAAHARTTAAELLDAMGADDIDVLVAGVGTGGTLSGVGRVLKARRSSTRVIAVEPDASAVLSGEPAGPTKIQGIGAGFVPTNLDRDLVDEVVRVSDLDAWRMKQRLATEEGLLVGISAGANVFAAIGIAERLGPDRNVVTLLCDTGERYFSLDGYFR